MRLDKCSERVVSYVANVDLSPQPPRIRRYRKHPQRPQQQHEVPRGDSLLLRSSCHLFCSWDLFFGLLASFFSFLLLALQTVIFNHPLQHLLGKLPKALVGFRVMNKPPAKLGFHQQPWRTVRNGVFRLWPFFGAPSPPVMVALSATKPSSTTAMLRRSELCGIGACGPVQR